MMDSRTLASGPLDSLLKELDTGWRCQSSSRRAGAGAGHSWPYDPRIFCLFEGLAADPIREQKARPCRQR
jgi:hypothetical protein